MSNQIAAARRSAAVVADLELSAELQEPTMPVALCWCPCAWDVQC